MATSAGRLPASILCAVDFSAHSERALRHAVALAAVGGGRLTIVAVNDPLLEAAASAAGRGGTLRDQVEAALVAVLARMPSSTAGGDSGHRRRDRRGRRRDPRRRRPRRRGTHRDGHAGTGRSPQVRLRIDDRSGHPRSFAAGARRAGLHARADRRRARRRPGSRFGHVVAAIGLDRFDAPSPGPPPCGPGRPAPHSPSPTSARKRRRRSWWPISDMPLPPALEESTDAARRQVEALAATLPRLDAARGRAPRHGGAERRRGGARARRPACWWCRAAAAAHRVGTIAYRVMREADVPTLVVAA